MFRNANCGVRVWELLIFLKGPNAWLRGPPDSGLVSYLSSFAHPAAAHLLPYRFVTIPLCYHTVLLTYSFVTKHPNMVWQEVFTRWVRQVGFETSVLYEVM